MEIQKRERLDYLKACFKEEFQKFDVRAGKAKNDLTWRLIDRLATLALGYKEETGSEKTFYRNVAGDWYKQQKAQGFFRNDEIRADRHHHSFYVFAKYLDDHYETLVLSKRSWWSRFQSRIRKWLYDWKRKRSVNSR